jgi:hypothetical protein
VVLDRVEDAEGVAQGDAAVAGDIGAWWDHARACHDGRSGDGWCVAAAAHAAWVVARGSSLRGPHPPCGHPLPQGERDGAGSGVFRLKRLLCEKV